MFYRRVFRDLKSNKARYFIIFLILAVVLTMVVENIMAACSIKNQMDDYFNECNAEDGEFVTFFSLSKNNIDELEDKNIQLEEQFYSDFELADNSTLRIFKNRNNINQLKLIEGNISKQSNQIVIENSYAEAHDLSVGGTIEIAGESFEIAGIGTVPDYVSIKKNITDLSTDKNLFGLAFVLPEDYDILYEKGESVQNQTIQYAYKLNGSYNSDDLKEYIKNMEIADEYKAAGIKNNLISLVEADKNERMTGFNSDISTTMSVSVMMGILMAVLVSFIIAIFESHTIDQESVVIGTLYALGVRKRALLRQYVLLPITVLVLGGITGILLGFALCPTAIKVSGEAYSYPVISSRFYPVSIVFGIILPALLGYIVNLIVINKKLKNEPLDLLRKTRKSLKPSKVKLKFKKFVNVYRIRQFIREKAIYIVLFIGVFYSVCIMLFSFTMFSALNNYVTTCTDDVNWSYMYTMKKMPEQIPDGAEKYASQKLSAYNKYSESDVDVTVIGVPENSEYFDIDMSCNDDEIVVSDCAARKFAWEKGDKIKLTDVDDGIEHEFYIKGITDYSAGLFLFMPDVQAHQVFNMNEDYYNLIFSKQKLDSLDSSLIYSITNRDDIKKSGNALMESMKPTIAIMLGASVIVFMAVMYLLLKQTIDKASFGISLIKIFGYKEKEVRRIFIDANFIIVFAASVLAIVLGKPVIDNMYPRLVTDIDIGFDTSFVPIIYLLAAVIIILTYFVSMLMLSSKLKKMDYTEVLKNRE